MLLRVHCPYLFINICRCSWYFDSVFSLQYPSQMFRVIVTVMRCIYMRKRVIKRTFSKYDCHIRILNKCLGLFFILTLRSVFLREFTLISLWSPLPSSSSWLSLPIIFLFYISFILFILLLWLFFNSHDMSKYFLWR